MTKTIISAPVAADSSIAKKARVARKQSPHVGFREAAAFALLKRASGACSDELVEAMNRSQHLSFWSLRIFVERYAPDHVLYKNIATIPCSYFVLPKGTAPKSDDAVRCPTLTTVRRRRAARAAA